MSDLKVPVGVSNRHLHLSQSDLEVLFGEGYQLSEMKPLSQPGQYAAQETVKVIGPKGSFPKVRILGPVRPRTQVEISKTDSFVLGVTPPIRDSGDINGSAAIILEGPQGRVELKEGLIIAQRHLHMHTDEAASLGLKDKEWISIKLEGERALTFDRVLVRAHPQFARDLHIDIDEANAAGVVTGDGGVIVK